MDAAPSLPHVNSGSTPLLRTQPQPPTAPGGSILDQLLPAKQNGLVLSTFLTFLIESILCFYAYCFSS